MPDRWSTTNANAATIDADGTVTITGDITTRTVTFIVGPNQGRYN